MQTRRHHRIKHFEIGENLFALDACDLRGPHRLTRPFEAHLMGDHLSPRRAFLTEVSAFLTGPRASRKHLFSVHGRQRSNCRFLSTVRAGLCIEPFRESTTGR